jgi:hypothetical protein
MKKKFFLVVLIVLVSLMVTFPTFADGGHGDEVVNETVGGGGAFMLSNTILIIGSLFLAIGAVGLLALFSKASLTKWLGGVVVLGLLSGFVHLGIGIQGDMLLLLNGLGYLALVAALFLPASFLVEKRRQILWVLLGYTIITFIGYFISHPLGGYSNMGLFTKLIELGLMGCLTMRIWEVGQAKSDQAAFG